jgi:hypothetical protein
MLPLREYLSNRRAEIQAQIKALRAELGDLDAAERGLASTSSDGPKRERGASGTGRKTLKELAIEVLQQRPEGAEANTIIAEIKSKHGIEVARESMSPQLSRLGQEGVLTREGLIWRLPGASASKDETPDFSWKPGDPMPRGDVDDDDL